MSNLVNGLNILDGNLIHKAASELKTRYGFARIGKLNDNIGTISYIFADGDIKFFLVCKRYIVFSKGIGGLVSATKWIVDRCFETDAKLLMYIQNEGKFYVFTPSEIIKSVKNGISFLNEFNGQSMYNFPVKYGKNIDKLGK